MINLPNCCVLVWVVVFLGQIVSAEIYSSTAHIKDELTRRRQDKSVLLLKQFLDSREQRHADIQRLLQTIDQLETDTKDPYFTVHHPLDAYRFIKNHSVVFNETIRDLVKEMQKYEIDQDEIDKITRNVTALDKDELLGAIKGLLRIQHIYGLPTRDLADGNVRGFNRGKMTARECQDMMSVAFYSDLIELAINWLDVGMERIEYGDNTTTLTKLLCKAAALAFNVKQEETAAVIYEFVIERNPKSRYHKHMMKYYKGYSKHGVVKYPLYSDSYRHACEMTIQPDKNNNKSNEHICAYVDNGHPLLRYQPAKVEVLSLAPYIVVYHDCFNSKFLSKMITFAKPYMHRSEVRKGEKVNSIAHYRTSKGTFFEKNGFLVDIYTYVEALTSLSWESFENFQVANYGIGGHYSTHHDTLNRNDKAFGDNNRIATFMIYMTDVEEGGATAFPRVNVSVLPKAGKAVFWYNLHPDGTTNHKVTHGACPVIIGDKWVGNIWIREHGQEFAQPCNLDKNDTMWKSQASMLSFSRSSAVRKTL